MQAFLVISILFHGFNKEVKQSIPDRSFCESIASMSISRIREELSGYSLEISYKCIEE
jgi:hypothetical protein